MPQISTSASSSIAAIPEGARVVVPPGPCTPSSLLTALGDRDWKEGIELCCAAQLPASVVTNDLIRITNWQLSGSARELFNRGRIDYLPMRYSDLAREFGPSGSRTADVLLAQFASPASDGSISPGLSGAVSLDIVHDVSLVLAEFNSELPFTRSCVEVRGNDIDFAVTVNDPIREPARGAPSPVDVAVAMNVATLIPDGATLQFGTGGVVETVLGLLGNHKDLGIHSGMVTEGVKALMEQGVITNRHKGYLDGVTAAGMVFGSPSLLQFLDRNDEFCIIPARVSHGSNVLSQLQKFVTINSAIEVDLTGQVNAESIDGRQFSGVGGQADYTWAASTSLQTGCRSVIALPSTAANGARSRIVSHLSDGAVVTSPRYCVDYVVTENGVANLRGRTLRERGCELIRVAHPAHREALERTFKGIG